MIRFLEQTVSQDRSGKNNFLYRCCWFVSVFFLLCGALCASGILGQSADGGIQIGWLWLVLLLVCLALAAMAFWGKDYLRLEYDYCITETIVDVSRVLNNKRRKQLCEFDLGKVSLCGPAAGSAFERAKSAPGLVLEKWYVHEDAPLYFFCHESGGQRHMTILELNDAMLEIIKTTPALRNGAWQE